MLNQAFRVHKTVWDFGNAQCVHLGMERYKSEMPTLFLGSEYPDYMSYPTRPLGVRRYVNSLRFGYPNNMLNMAESVKILHQFLDKNMCLDSKLWRLIII